MLPSAWQCPCHNVSVTPHREAAVPPHPFPPAAVAAAAYAQVRVRYAFLAATAAVAEWSVVRCAHCATDVCAQRAIDGPVLLLRADPAAERAFAAKPLSETYGIRLDRVAVVPGFVGAEQQRAIAAVRQQKVRELFDAKEAKIAAFIRREEERYEAEKHAVELEERDMLAACLRAAPAASAEASDDESEFRLDFNPVPPPETPDDSPSPAPASPVLDAPAGHRPPAHLRVFRLDAHSPAADDLPRTFQEYVAPPRSHPQTLQQKASDVPVSGSYVPSSYRSILGSEL